MSWRTIDALGYNVVYVSPITAQQNDNLLYFTKYKVKGL